MTSYTSEKIRIISFVAILLVVFLHAYNLDSGNGVLLFDKSPVWFIQDIISFGVTRIAVPIFFLISGFLFFFKTSGTLEAFRLKIIKRFRTLLIPFLFWSLAGIFLYFFLQQIPQLQGFFSKGLVRDYSLEKWLVTIFVHPIPYQFWFIRDLMVLVLLSPLLYQIIRGFGKVAIVIVALLWMNDVGVMNNSVEAFLFFLSGGYLALYMPQIADAKPKVKNPWWFLFAWLFFLVLKSTWVYLDMPQTISVIFFKLSIIFGIAAFWFGYDELMGEKGTTGSKLIHLSGYTFFVYASHEPALTILKKLLFGFLGKTEMDHLIVYFVAPTAVIFLSLVAGWLFKRYAIGFYSLITGGR
jgi:surface polysaccharide O-acyltransferase-like enzyme